MGMVTMTPVVELSQEGSIIINDEKILEYLAAHDEMAHMVVRDFFAMLADMSEVMTNAERMFFRCLHCGEKRLNHWRELLCAECRDAPIWLAAEVVGVWHASHFSFPTEIEAAAFATVGPGFRWTHVLNFAEGTCLPVEAWGIKRA